MSDTGVVATGGLCALRPTLRDSFLYVASYDSGRSAFRGFKVERVSN